MKNLSTLIILKKSSLRLEISLFLVMIFMTILPSTNKAQVDNDNVNIHILASEIIFYCTDTELEKDYTYKLFENGEVIFQDQIYSSDPLVISPAFEVMDETNINFQPKEYKVDLWEDDTAPWYEFNDGDDCACGAANITTIDIDTLFPMQKYLATTACPYTNSALQNKIVLNYHFRYHLGDTEDEPLEFGTIPIGENRTHQNRLNFFGSPNDYPGINTDITYSSSKNANPFSPSPEVFYTFTVNGEDACQKANISVTSNSQNTNDTRLMIFSYDNNELGDHILTDIDINPSLDDVYLSNGEYAVIMEGLTTWLLTLNIEIDALEDIQSGSISFSGFEQTYKGYNPTTITSSINPSGDYTDVQWERQINNGLWEELQGATSFSYNPPTINYVGTTNFRRKVFNSSCDSETYYSNIITIETFELNGNVSGKIQSPNGGGVSGVEVTLENIDPLTGSNDITLTTTTNFSGYYSFPNFYVGPDAAVWRVTPDYLDHEFQPVNLDFTLSNNANIIDNANFTDISSFDVSGNIYHNFNFEECGMAGITILRNGIAVGMTDEDGNYTITVPNIDTWEIKPELENHTFNPSSYSIYVSDHTDNIDFEDQKRNNVNLYVQTNCGDALGSANFTIQDTTSFPCPQFTFDTNIAGEYSKDFPAKPYVLFMNSFTLKESINENIITSEAIVNYFNLNPIEIDLTYSDTTLYLIYKPAPTLIIEDIPEPPCPDIDYGVIPIHEYHTILLNAYDIPPGVLSTNHPGCRLDTGLINIENYISTYTNDPEMDTIEVVPYTMPFSFKGGVPNLAIPYTKNLNFILKNSENNSSTEVVKLIVEGNRPRESTFTTVSPEVPLFILRDPPGDLSFSSVTEGKSWEQTSSFGTGYNLKVGGYAQIVGDYEYDGLENTKIWGNAGGSFYYTSESSSATENTVTTSVTSTYNTSADQYKESIGQDADVYVGAAMNMKYSIADMVRVDYNRCEVKKTEELCINPDKFQTTFIYSEHFIKNTLIPNIRDEIIANTTNEDSIQFYTDQINIWENILRQNQELKESAEFLENFSFDANAGEFTKEYTSDSTYSVQHEWTRSFNADFWASFGGVYGGIGAEGGAFLENSWVTSSSNSFTANSALTVSYTLDDDDLGDFFTVDVKKDNMYPSHIFVAQAAETSCPYEPGTLPRHDATLIPNFSTQYNVPADEEAEYILTLTNNSQSGDALPYFLDFNGPSNDDNAEVSWNIQFESVIWLNPFESKSFVINIGRNTNSDVYAYEGLEFRAFPGCADGGEYAMDQNNPLAVVRLNTYFDAPCSNITIEEPVDDWFTSQANISELDIQLKDYDVNNISSLFIQYASLGSTVWKNAFNVDPFTLNPNPNIGTTVTWNTSTIPDGDYRIRANINCPDVINYSDTKRGKIDNTPPLKVGSPFPIDHKLTYSNFIGLDINEEISTSLNENNVILRNNLTQNEYEVQVIIVNNRIIVQPIADIVNLPPAPYTVIFKNIADKYGNEIEEDIEWWFTTGDYQFNDCDSTNIYYVDMSLNRNDTWQDGSDWENAFVTLGEALLTACPGSKIYVAEGTYYPTDHLYPWNSDQLDSISGDNIYLEWTHNYDIYGGFPSGGAPFHERNPYLYETIINGDSNKDGIHNDGDCHTLLYVRDNIQATLNGFIFESTFANGTDLIDRSGAIFNNGSPTIINCTFRNNIVDNTSDNGTGAGIFNNNGNITIVNSIFHDNLSDLNGGAITSLNGNTNLINSTFVNNDSPNPILNAYNSTMNVGNCIFKGNAGGDFINNIQDSTIVQYSITDNSLPSIINNLAGNIEMHELEFENEAENNFKPVAGELSEDSGLDNIIAGITTKDIEGTLRILSSINDPAQNIDRGAFERKPCNTEEAGSIIYVDISNDSPLDGFTWENALTDLNAALLKAKNCNVDTICIAAGIYYPIPSTGQSQREATFTIESGMVIKGGYPAGGGVQNYFQHKTILSGNVGDVSLDTDNSYHVITVETAIDTSIIEGLIVTSGNANGTGRKEYGAGLYHRIEGLDEISTLIIKNCEFFNNRGKYGSGITNVSKNGAQARISIQNCNIHHNYASFHGGGIYDLQTINGSSFTNVENSLIHHNSAWYAGGAFALVGNQNSTGNPSFLHCTITDNKTFSNDNLTGGIWINQEEGSSLSAYLKNSILWGNENKGPNISQISPESTQFFHLESTNIQGGLENMPSSNMNVFPHFAASYIDDYRMDACSNLFDIANASYPVESNLDVYGNPRSVNGADIGAVETPSILSRGQIPNSLDDLVLSCIKPLNYPIPEDGLIYTLYDDELTILMDGPESASPSGSYLTTNDDIASDTTFQVIVGREGSYAMNFEGTDGYIEIPHHESQLLNMSESWTISSRVKFESGSSIQEFLFKEDYLSISFDNEKLTIDFIDHNQYDYYLGFEDLFPQGLWKNIYFHYTPIDENSGSLLLFYNGRNLGTKIISTATNTSATSSMKIGGGGTNEWNGEIDFFAITKASSPVFQLDFISAAGSNTVIDNNLENNQSTPQNGILSGLDRYEVWVEGEDSYIKICPDTLTLSILIDPQTITRFVMNNLDEGYQSLRNTIQESCPNDTIRFANILVGDTIKFESEIFLPQDLFIEGLGMNNGITLDGQGLTRLFSSPVDRTITYKDLQLINGQHTSAGGAFPVPNDCTLWNVRLAGNNAATDNKQLLMVPFSNLKIKGAVHLTPE